MCPGCRLGQLHTTGPPRFELIKKSGCIRRMCKLFIAYTACSIVHSVRREASWLPGRLALGEFGP